MRDLNKLFGLPEGTASAPPETRMRRRTPTFNFPPLPRAFADAMRTNRRPTELVMLPVDWNPANVPARAVVQIKYDGIHTCYRGDRRTAVTREGVEMACTSHLADQLHAVASQLRALYASEHVMVGEYTSVEGFEDVLADFKRGRGTGAMMIFDAVPVAVYEGREPSLPLEQRMLHLQNAFSRTLPVDRFGVSLAPATIFEGEARDNIELAAGKAWALGYEGLVVKDADSPFVRARSGFWQRIKRVHTVDVPIVAVDAPGGRLKAIVVRAGADQTCRVGVGFSDAQRTNPAAFQPGAMVEVRHLGVTPGGSLRSPSFVRLRNDKES